MRVAMLAHASADSLALSLAVPSCGGVLVQLNWRQPEATLATMLSGLGCALLMVGRGFAATGRRLRERSGVAALWLIDDEEIEPGASDEVRVSCDPAATTSGDGNGSSGSSNGGYASPRPPSASDVAVVMFTSGTSALPKPVPLTHAGLLWSCKSKLTAEREVLGIGDGDKTAHRGTLAFLPSFHVIGFTNNFLYNLYAGVRCMVHADASTIPNSGPLLLRACEELRPSILDTVPALLNSLVVAPGSPAAAAAANGASNGASSLSNAENGVSSNGNGASSSIRPSDAATLRSCAAVLYGGAQLTRSTADALANAGVRCYSQYGQTELGGMALMGAPDCTERGGWMRPVGGIRMRLEQSSGEADNNTLQGQLMLRGVGSLTPGYWKLDSSSSSSSSASRDDDFEWATGDVFEQSADGGWVRHVCRRDELLLHTSGEMTNPVAVEASLTSALQAAGAPFSEVCVFGQGRPIPALVIEMDVARAPLLASAEFKHESLEDGAEDDEESDNEDGGRKRDVEMGMIHGGGLPLLHLTSDENSPSSLRSVLLSGLDAASQSIASYSCPPIGLIILVHPGQHQPLQRTAKGGIVRSAIEERFAPFVDAALRRSAAAQQPHPAVEPTPQKRAEDASKRSSSHHQNGNGTAAVHGDSLGLVALMRGGGTRGSSSTPLNGMTASEQASDALVQHLKVFFLFAVLLRHLQRFTVKTCHAWLKVPPEHAAVCVANNVLQTGAAEGLAFLSGVALASAGPISMREVASPLVLILVFRIILHPLLEWLLAYRAEIGVAHLWFILMIGFGRLLCLPLSRLPKRARRLRLTFVCTFVLWRLLLAPTHIGYHGLPLLRRPLYFLLFGDRNYLQIVHNLPLFMLGFVHADIRVVCRAQYEAFIAHARRVLPNGCLAAALPPAAASKKPTAAAAEAEQQQPPSWLRTQLGSLGCASRPPPRHHPSNKHLRARPVSHRRLHQED